MTADEKAAKIAEDNLYGRVICRCETVTEGEIVEASTLLLAHALLTV
mgnify:CR=1 FL=1